ncbi:MULTISPECIES: hypothetical protein [unclassified Lysobacter]|uniref:hypothetical protein n=1 Tax=unclassified Lysobacter TaxID=2635362 RepID=UPI001BED3918|nr:MULTISPECIES: hypothetical protein [unclassified Lysobacter]MBT2749060.1 hypothetical protein [Lysobacter sp. ISL-42]MBT2754124.1 hypothetical protein [Lysobacter sp. ISL-50]MBT2779116.1 hypothetical protein [Lysobacter sp. ISL-54]MBT2784437.1 hypothetical protein [Lysobacter sp. ISL-52]
MIFHRAIRIAMAGAAITKAIEAPTSASRADIATRRASTTAEATDLPRPHIHRAHRAAFLRDA